jgi:hypothetical protein
MPDQRPTRTERYINALRHYSEKPPLLSSAQLQKLIKSPNPVNPFDAEPSRYENPTDEHVARRAFKRILGQQGWLDWKEVQTEARKLMMTIRKDDDDAAKGRSETANLQLLDGLVNDVQKFRPVFWSGRSIEEIQDCGRYQTEGVCLDTNDLRLGNLYAGLSVLARDMYAYLANYPRDDSAAFQEVVMEVSAVERRLHHGVAFPTYEDQPIDFPPTGLADDAASGKPTVKPLGDPKLVHERTVIPGKMLFETFLTKFGIKFKDAICGKNGPYQQLEKRQALLTALPTAIAIDILKHSFSNDTLWYPLAVYIAVLLVRAGLKTYCESEVKPTGRRRRST